LIELDLRLGAVLVILVLGTLVGGDYVLSSQVKGVLDVRVKERSTMISEDGKVEVEIEVIIANSHSFDARLSGATLTTYLDGERVASEDLEPITVGGNSEKTIIIKVQEDLSEAPEEDSLTLTLDFEAKTKAFLFQNQFQKRNLLTTMSTDSPTETPPPGDTPEEADTPEGQTGTVIDEARLGEFVDNIQSGGPPPDGIPPIEIPRYISTQEADEFLEDDDVVFILESSDPIKIYPQYVLVWHEIVNEVLDGELISITYCPLTGSTIGYKGDIKAVETTFGTSGKLLNSNLVMYDRETDSYWPQVLGVAINGPSKGEALGTTPVAWTLWGLARAEFPEALVLSDNTGFIRNYGADPYGSYFAEDSYYQTGEPFFPIMSRNSRLPPKEVVIGIKAEGAELAVPKNSVADAGVLNLELGRTPVVAIYDESLDVVRVYSRLVNGETIEFSIQDGAILDRSGSTWNVRGEAVESAMEGESLTQINHFDVMWFAWSAFYPDAELIQ
jgi:hypothetical protein